MDDHTYFILRKIERNIFRIRLVLDQLRLHVADLPTNRSSDAQRRIREAYLELERECRIRAALLEPNPGTYMH